MSTDKRGEWVVIHTGEDYGRQCFPLDLQPEDVSLETIAHALSQQCRYMGHTAFPISVAYHSVLVSCALERDYPDRRDLWKWGLLHDASEAYLQDVARPLKTLPAFSEYREIEGRIAEVVAKRFALSFTPGVRPVEPPEVQEADRKMLMTEKAYVLPNGTSLVPASPVQWGEAQGFKAGASVYEWVQFREMPWDAAKMLFLARGAELWAP